MVKITRSKLESTVVNLFLDILRTNLEDTKSTPRVNKNWIRSQEQIRNDTPDPNKRQTIKNSEFVGYPEVIVEAFQSKAKQKTTYVSTNVNYENECELTIRIKDVGSVVNTGNLGSQIEDVLESKRSTFMLGGITKLEWSNINTGNYASDNNEYNERQIICTFIARTSSWQTGR